MSDYEKNNLPINIKILYNEIIEEYQTILHYEHSVITKEELISKLTEYESRRKNRN